MPSFSHCAHFQGQAPNGNQGKEAKKSSVMASFTPNRENKSKNTSPSQWVVVRRRGCTAQTHIVIRYFKKADYHCALPKHKLTL